MTLLSLWNMALVTVQRSPSSTIIQETTEIDGVILQEGEDEASQAQARLRSSISECYFAVKGAALVLPQNESVLYRKATQNGGDIQQHLQSMFYLLRQEDTLKMAVKLESGHVGRTRYLVVVSCTGKQSTEESCLLGVDCNDRTTIGLVLPVWADTRITLDGDGGFSVSTTERHHIFKPVSVQAMWSALQTLHKASHKAHDCNYYKGGLTHSWLEYYEKKIGSDRSCLNEWHAMDNLETRRPPSPDCLTRLCPKERAVTETDIREKLKEIMMTVDLDEVTSKYIRTRLEEVLDMDLNEYKSFIDQEMITILGQMDEATEIFEYLYLGSEWNASNLEELQKNGVGHILNVTHEIDNFFPGMFEYLNIRVYDDEGTELLKHWDKTYKFITNAREKGSKVLVHCKMGVSRSASVVIAYAMKAHNWNMQKAQGFVKDLRPCIKPNTGFMRQLEIYQGILGASKHRHNTLWRSKSENNLKMQPEELRPETMDTKSQPEELQKPESIYLLETPAHTSRPKSWSPDDNTADMLFPQTTPDSPEAPAVAQDTVDGDVGAGSSGSNAKSRNHVLLQCRDDKSYSVSPNKALHLALPAGPVKFQIGGGGTDDDDNYCVCECKNPVFVNGEDEAAEIVAQVGTLQRVNSVKDRISELESAAQTAEPKVAPVREHLDLPENMGLVLNLTNHFEAVSKSNPSSPVDENGPVVGSPPTAVDLQGNAPILSQTKPAALRHQAVLVHPEAWDENPSPAEATFRPPSSPVADPKELIMRVRVNSQLKQMAGAAPDEGIAPDSGLGELRTGFFEVRRLSTPSSPLLLAKVHDPFSAHLDHVFEREERRTEVPARHDSWGSCDSAIGLQIPGRRESPSRQSSWGSVESRGVLLSRECSWNSADAIPRRRPYGAAAGSVSPDAIDNLFMSEREPASPWATGTVKRGKAAADSDGCLKRTNSFDDALPLSSGGAVTPDGPAVAQEPAIGYSIQRSQSLRTNTTSSRHSFFKNVTGATPNFSLHGPKPYRSPAGNRPDAGHGTSQAGPTPHYASTPILYKGRTESVAPGPLHSASHPNITFAPSGLSATAPSRPAPAPEQVPCTGIVRHQKEVLENFIASLPSRAVPDVPATIVSTPPPPPPPERKACSADEWKRIQLLVDGRSPKAASSSSPETEDGTAAGVVKRITREMEAKGVGPGASAGPPSAADQPPDCDKVIILDQHGKVFELPVTSAGAEAEVRAAAADDKSVKSLVGKFEPPARPRYFSETEATPPVVRTSGCPADAARLHRVASLKSDRCGAVASAAVRKSDSGQCSENGHRLRSCNSWNGAPSGTPSARDVQQPPRAANWNAASGGGLVGAFVQSTNRPPPAVRTSIPASEPSSLASPPPAAQRKIRKLQAGKSHPLSQLTSKHRHLSALYNTM